MSSWDVQEHNRSVRRCGAEAKDLGTSPGTAEIASYIALVNPNGAADVSGCRMHPISPSNYRCANKSGWGWEKETKYVHLSNRPVCEAPGHPHTAPCIL